MKDLKYVLTLAPSSGGVQNETEADSNGRRFTAQESRMKAERNIDCSGIVYFFYKYKYICYTCKINSKHTDF